MSNNLLLAALLAATLLAATALATSCDSASFGVATPKPSLRSAADVTATVKAAYAAFAAGKPDAAAALMAGSRTVFDLTAVSVRDALHGVFSDDDPTAFFRRMEAVWDYSAFDWQLSGVDVERRTALVTVRVAAARHNNGGGGEKNKATWIEYHLWQLDGEGRLARLTRWDADDGTGSRDALLGTKSGSILDLIADVSAAWKQHDAARLAQLLADDIVIRMQGDELTPSGVFHGRDTGLAQYAAATPPGLELDISAGEPLLVDGARAVTRHSHQRVVGAAGDSWQGRSGVAIWLMRDGKLAEFSYIVTASGSTTKA